MLSVRRRSVTMRVFHSRPFGRLLYACFVCLLVSIVMALPDTALAQGGGQSIHQGTTGNLIANGGGILGNPPPTTAQWPILLENFSIPKNTCPHGWKVPYGARVGQY